MTTRTSKLGLLVVASGCLLFAATDSRAGAGPNSFAFCLKTPGTSMCQGTMLGFANSSDPQAYAQFQTNPNHFTARLNGQDYSCAVSSTQYPQVAAAWSQTTSFKSLFFIYWDAQGICSNLVFANASNYP